MIKNTDKNIIEEILREILLLLNRQAVMPSIDRDLALDKLRQAYDLLLNMKSSDKELKTPNLNHEEITKKGTNPLEIEEDIQETETLNDEIAKDELIPDIKFEEKIPAPHAPEQDLAKVRESDVEIDLFGENKENPNEEEPISKVADSPDLFSGVSQQETLSDTLSREMPKETLVDQFQKNKIEHLKEAIGINEKFFFLNELFDGDLSEYNQAIDTLDGLSNADEAKAFMATLAEQNKWNEHEQAGDQFKEFINRKFTDR